MNYDNPAIQGVNIGEKYKDRNWIDRQVRRGRMTEEFKLHLLNTLEALNSIYPSDRYSIEFELEIVKTKLITSDYGYAFFKHDEYRGNLIVVSNSHGVITDESNQVLEEHIIHNPNAYYKSHTSRVVEYPHHFEFKKTFVTVHYPEVTITNEQDQQITIKNFFAQLRFDEDGYDEKVFGWKTDYTHDEFAAGYRHSHLSRFSFEDIIQVDLGLAIQPREFCLGHGEIKESISFYNCDSDSPNLMLVYYCMDALVEWESLEGGPHIKMEDVLNGEISVIAIESRRINTYFEAFLERWRDIGTPDWIFRDDLYHIVDNDKFEAMLFSVLTTRRISDMKLYIVYKNERGEYYQNKGFTPDQMKDIRQRLEVEMPFYTFKGVYFPLTVSGETKVKGEIKQYIHPEIKEYVKSKLELVGNKKARRNSILRAEG